MTDVTRILSAAAQGDPSAAAQLLPLVYDELRQLAAQRLAHEKPGQTLDATALVHEAYLRLVDVERAQHWNSRGHFFAAAAEAMRCILVDNARHKQSQKRGGDRVRLDLDQLAPATSERLDEVMDIDAALVGLANADPQAAELVKLRYSTVSAPWLDSGRAWSNRNSWRSCVAVTKTRRFWLARTRTCCPNWRAARNAS